MKELKLYRKRFIPNETVLLEDDQILYHDDEVLITKWKVLRPKVSFDHGISCYYLDEGYKISKFYNENNELVYYYCDIIETTFDATENAYIFSDLLVDVIIYPDGFVEVADVRELADALEEGTITQQMLKAALIQLDRLLHIIYQKQFPELIRFLEMKE